ncbi:MAG: heavy metal-binding domain-containing protein [Proteobacteria bacterium]|nr:heavy metal-binding domain-containing protein [Pseudomonadota bacterium]
MLMTTTPYVEGYVIKKYGPLVASEAVMGTNLFRDYFAKVRDVVGGRSGAFQTALQEARMVVLKEIEEQAMKSGCNAVIGLDLDYGEVSGKDKNMLIVAVQGTAVFLEPRNKR